MTVLPFRDLLVAQIGKKIDLSTVGSTLIGYSVFDVGEYYIFPDPVYPKVWNPIKIDDIREIRWVEESRMMAYGPASQGRVPSNPAPVDLPRQPLTRD